ncbi:MAG: transferrin-binding protein-like solute binding protein [Rhodospirillaceae bacterium]|nr:transferrin-binding protein-like solute binding protein [Rhodospirillaceae bacterium]
MPHVDLHPVLKITAIFAVALLITSCGGGSSMPATPITPSPPPVSLPTGVDQRGTGSPTDPLTAFTTTASFSISGRQNMQLVTFSGAEPTPTITQATDPTMRLDRTTTGFNLISDQFNIGYDTRTGSLHRIYYGYELLGPNEYVSCSVSGFCGGAQGGIPRFFIQFNSGAQSALSYTTYGVWYQNVFPSSFATQATFATGLPSTTAQMPPTGTASFSGGASGLAGTNRNDTLRFKGDATLSVDFAARSVSGGITGITTERLSSTTQTGKLGNITFSGGTITGAAFTGLAAAPTLTGTASNIVSTSGTFGGQFYGPNAQEAGGTFAMTGSGWSIIGAFGVKK